MSTLSVSNITDGTDTVETGYVVNGSAKVLVNFNGSGTIAARDSVNLASLTDSGTGQYKINFTNSFSNSNYTAQCNTENDGNIGHVGSWNTGDWSIAARNNSTNSLQDENFICASIHGDLA